MALPEQVEVLVVGAGPTGLAAACGLRQAGVQVLAVDRAEEGGSETSRAAVLHAGTLEVLQNLDVTGRLLAEGVVVPVLTVREGDKVLARVDFSGLPTAYPYTLMLPQSRTEAILARRLAELGGGVARPYQATAVSRAGFGAAVTLTGPDGGQHTVHARWVIGADGMHSAVRQAAGIGFTGGRYEQCFLLADVRLHWPLPPGEVQLFLASAGPVVVAPLPGGRHRLVAAVDTAPEPITDTDVQALLDQRGPVDAHVDELMGASRFRVHHRLADAYRRGPVLLAGDAAHVHSPAGGQGMNTGIQDALDLASTLHTALCAGDHPGSDAVLDGYQQRRRPIAQRVVTLTDHATRLATLTNPAARTARNLAISTLSRLPAIEHRLARQLAELTDHPAATEPGRSPFRGSADGMK